MAGTPRRLLTLVALVAVLLAPVDAAVHSSGLRGVASGGAREGEARTPAVLDRGAAAAIEQSAAAASPAAKADAEDVGASGKQWLATELRLFQGLVQEAAGRTGLSSAISVGAVPEDVPGGLAPAPAPNAPVHYRLHPLESVVTWAVLTALVGLLYRTYRATPALELEKARTAFKGQDFMHGPFSCLEDMDICCWSLWCSGVRWSDSMNAVGVLTFWLALSFFIIVEALSAIPGLLFIWVLAAIVCTFFRQELRRAMDMESGNLLCDLLLWCFCPFCAVSQEARQVKEARLLEQSV